MKVVMVKHRKSNKTYWFEVPESIAEHIDSGVRVICDTAQGMRYCTTVSPVMDTDDDSLWDIMENSDVFFPLKKITAVFRNIPISNIIIPKYMKRTKPRSEKIAKRFLEYYYTGFFSTDIVINKDGVLTDGYSAYLVAKKIGLKRIPAICKAE